MFLVPVHQTSDPHDRVGISRVVTWWCNVVMEASHEKASLWISWMIHWVCAIDSIIYFWKVSLWSIVMASSQILSLGWMRGFWSWIGGPDVYWLWLVLCEFGLLCWENIVR